MFIRDWQPPLTVALRCGSNLTPIYLPVCGGVREPFGNPYKTMPFARGSEGFS